MSIKDNVSRAVQGFNNFASSLNFKLKKLNDKYNGLKLEIPLIISKSKYKVFYIDSVNGNDNNTGSYRNPFKNIDSALNNSLENDYVLLLLKRGQTFFIGGKGDLNPSSENKLIEIKGYGNAPEKPILKGVVNKFKNTGKYHCAAFEANLNLNIFCENIIIETGKLNKDQSMYSVGYGSFFSRGKHSLLFKKMKLSFYKCDIKIQNVPLVSSLRGFMELKMVQCNIINEGQNDAVISTPIPKIIHLSNLNLKNFTKNKSLNSLFSLTDKNHIRYIDTQSVRGEE